jgi:hypothetical protein
MFCMLHPGKALRIGQEGTAVGNCCLRTTRISEQGWGKIHPIRIRIRIREYSAILNFEEEGIVRRIRIRILKLKFEFA